MDDLLREFLAETSENVAALDVEIVKLERNPNDPALLSTIFRLVHTIKGTCSFLRLPRLEHITHAGENVLSKFRDGELHVTSQAVSLILHSIDAIKSILEHLEKYECEPDGDDNDLISSLNTLAESSVSVSEATLSGMGSQEDIFFSPVAVVSLSDDQNIKTVATSIVDHSIRVDVNLLENLITTVSELVLTRNQLLQIMRQQKDPSFLLPLQRLNQVTTALQESVMKTRMQPIGNAWSKLPRLVRDLAHELHKKIDLQMFGAETELDRQVLALIKDPLTHMVRNSADHGIELPSERIVAGKAETGTIIVNAYHEGGHIVIEVSDDGYGLDLSKIKAKILQKNLATEAKLIVMSDQQIMQFIFKPGFSTAPIITSVSGRGVGMDVVKTNIEKIGGVIDFESQQGKGSRFYIKIPLTLAIVSALIIESGGERFAIPQISVIELVKTSNRSEHRIESINSIPVLRLRNRLLPLVSLQNLLQLGHENIDGALDYFVVVVRVGNSTFGIIVDHIFDTEEIVAKPVSSVLRNIRVFSGNTILGDGSIIMILDLNGIVEHMGSAYSNTEVVKQSIATVETTMNNNRQSMLLFHAGGGAPKAVPLSLVARLEEIDRKSIEHSNGSMVVQYRGQLMPLIPFIALPDSNESCSSQPIVVFTAHDKNMGLMVDKIVDIVEDNYCIDLSSRRPGYLGTSIISGKATDIIDATYYLSQAFTDWIGGSSGSHLKSQDLPRVLLIDDSLFFRNLLTPLLTVAGYDVTTLDNPASALKLQDEGYEFDIIISDIEMPGMNGFEFTATVRKGEGKWSRLPIVALSSHENIEDIDRGREAGFTDCVVKFNREGLLSILEQNINRVESL